MLFNFGNDGCGAFFGIDDLRNGANNGGMLMLAIALDERVEAILGC